MKRIAILTASAVGLWLLSLALPGKQQQALAQGGDGEKLALQAKVILEKYCEKCHGQTKLKGAFDVRDAKTMQTKDKKGRVYVSQAGKDQGVKDSYLWARIENDSMPEEGGPIPDAEKATLKKWLEAGAPAWKEAVAERTYVSQETVLRAIYNDIKAADEEDQPYLRYFTFTNLHNNPKITDEQLARYKAGLSKAFNSMHWKKPIVILRALKSENKAEDPQHTVFAFDLRDVDWDKKHDDTTDRWSILLRYYPYGIRYDDVSDDKLAKLDRELFGDGKNNKGLARGTLVYLRADWYMAMATRPPVYEQILRLPPNAGKLEVKLGVDVAKNFKRNRLARSGFTRSGVSEQHRMIERHDSLYGAYWKSYDFLKDAKDGDLLRLPLGPIFKAEYNGKYPYEDVAFKHDGGEMIFNLPNGLQGYYLARGDDTYLDKGPIDVVKDPLSTSGTPEIVNGLSCMYCHAKGMIDNGADQVRLGTAVVGDARRKVRKIYPDYAKMQEYYEADAELFQSAAKKAMRPFLKSDKDLEVMFDKSNEPISDLARKHYNPDLDLAVVAYELGYSTRDIPKFEGAIESNQSLKDLTLGTLINKGSMKRQIWGDIKGRSLYQRTLNTLDKGRPWNTR